MSATPEVFFVLSVCRTFLPFLPTVKRRRKLMPGAENWRERCWRCKFGKKWGKTLTSQNGDEKNAGESQESFLKQHQRYIELQFFIQNLRTIFRESQSSSWRKRIPGCHFYQGPTRERLECRSWIFPSMARTLSRTCRSCNNPTQEIPKKKGFASSLLSEFQVPFYGGIMVT